MARQVHDKDNSATLEAAPAKIISAPRIWSVSRSVMARLLRGDWEKI
jgi:hypothetical protein